MHRALKLHPSCACGAVNTIEVQADRPRPAELRLCYVMSGRISDIRIPAATAPTRTHELWKHTCFEAFVRGAADDSYHEFNFAPSTQWAAYQFDGYRSDMKVAEELTAAAIAVNANERSLEVSVSLALDGLANLPADAAWQLGLSAVIEETNGRRSYWALAHPPGKPDFHHSDCFVVVLPSASHT